MCTGSGSGIRGSGKIRVSWSSRISRAVKLSQLTNLDHGQLAHDRILRPGTVSAHVKYCR